MIAYCDYIAHTARQGLLDMDKENLLTSVGKMQWDLDPKGGWFVSTKKTIEVVDKNGKQYKITVEEM